MIESDRIRARLPTEILSALSRMARKRKTSVSSLLEDLLRECLTAKGELPAAVYVVLDSSVPKGSVMVFTKKATALKETGVTPVRIEVK